MGTEVTPGRLIQVERAERELRLQGFRQLRVRHHGATARLELDPEGLERVADPERRRAAERVVEAAGFRRIVIDPRGYRAGGADPDAPSAGTSAEQAGRRPILDGGQ